MSGTGFLTVRAQRVRFVEVYDQDALDEFRREVFCAANETFAAPYLNSLAEHIRYVRLAGVLLLAQLDWGEGDDPKGEAAVRLPHLLGIHDQSKFSDEEFEAAAERFHGGDPNPDRYGRAWLHHVHANPHHWQHWIFPDGFVPRGTSVEAGVMEMPPEYALEMVADWMGSSMAYTGSWDMTKWLNGNMGRIRLHTKTAACVREILRATGYPDEVVGQPWAQELG